MASKLTPIQKKKVRAVISDYCLRSEVNRLKRHYSQHRPIEGYGLEPEQLQSDDCSGFESKVFFYVMHKTHIYLLDPLDERHGWGYTGSQYEYLKHTPAPKDKYLVGDMAIFGT